MQKLIIMAYMGTGKTELENRYDNVVDFDFQDYKYIYDESIRHLPLEQRKGSTSLRTENPNYPENFLKDALKLLDEGKIVVSPFIKHVFEAYDSEEFKKQAKDVRIILVCPERNNFLEYVERFKQRGNSAEFISRREKEFSSLVDLFEQATDYERVTIKKGEYLSSALKEYGIDLNSYTKDQEYMKLAIELSSKAYYPYGAVIVKDDKIIGRSDADVLVAKTPYSHAELRALESAMEDLGGHLCAEGGKGVTIYSSCEPCAMCMGAILYTGIDRLVYGATLEDSDECVNEILAKANDIAKICSNREIEIVPEVLKEEAVKVLTKWKKDNSH